MDSTTGKRSADSDQVVTVDTFAVCSKCTRLSNNLRQCDHCGSPLSEDNASVGYSAEPKRSRTDATVNGGSNGTTSGRSSAGPPVTTASEDTNAMPVPQALYVNKNAAANLGSGEPSLRPQALYVNLNNQAIPLSIPNSQPSSVGGLVSSAQTTTRNSTDSTASLPGSASSGSSATMSNSYTGGTAMSAMSQASAINQNMAGHAQPRIQPMHSYNLQPPPPYPNAVSAVTGPPAAGGLVPNANSNPNMFNPPNTIAPNEPVVLAASQIRIGIKKFQPNSPVTFKDDGILFTLKDYTNAPVLLNARAILNCKACLDQYPTFFLYLESSCMKQIRMIFQLTENDFSDNNPVPVKRCITIIPMLPFDSPATQGRQLRKNLRQIFQVMNARYPRRTSYLEEISVDNVVDMFYGPAGADRAHSSQPPAQVVVSSRSGGTTSSHAPSSRAPQQQQAMVQLATSSNIPQMQNMSHNRMSQSQSLLTSASSNLPPLPSLNPSLSAPTPQQASSRGPRPAISNHPNTAAPISTVSNPQVINTPQKSVPLLVLPSDPQKWALMQKDLVVGGVYHVELPSGQRKYYLWNGSQLVPCLVHNTEVQLNCSSIRVGSLKAESVGPVRVRADQQAGIIFTVKCNTPEPVKVHLLPEWLVTCQVCFESVTAVFITLTSVAANAVRNKLKIGISVDPGFNPSSSEERRKHIILFLNNVNGDQKDAMLQMRRPHQNNAAMFEEIFVLKALQTLSAIKSNTKRVQTKIDDYVNKATSLLDLAKELTEPDDKNHSGSNTPTVLDDDDDDDVIMTSEEVGIKCPYTQQVMKEPMRNKYCGHSYEGAAIQEFILRRKGNAKCPYAGCGNTRPMQIKDLEENTQLKEYIAKNNPNQ